VHAKQKDVVAETVLKMLVSQSPSSLDFCQNTTPSVLASKMLHRIENAQDAQNAQ
jgi:hypothetical protein